MVSEIHFIVLLLIGWLPQKYCPHPPHFIILSLVKVNVGDNYLINLPSIYLIFCYISLDFDDQSEMLRH